MVFKAISMLKRTSKTWIILIGAFLLMAHSSSIESVDEANELIEKNYLEEALNIYNQLIEKDQDNLDLIYDRGLLLLKLFESEKALVDFKTIRSLSPDDFKGYLGLAEYHAYKYNIVPSIGYLNSALEKTTSDEDRFKYLLTRGEVMMRFNMYAEAEKALLEATTINADDFYLIELFSLTLGNQGKGEEALEYLHIVSDDQEMTAQTLAKMGYLMNNIEQYAEANLYLEQALNMAPNNADALANIAFTYLKLNDPKHALKKIEKSIKNNPLNAYAYRVRGEIWGDLGKPSKACRDFNRAISLDYSAYHQDDITDLAGIYCGQQY